MIALRLRTLLLFGLAIFGLTLAGGMTSNVWAHGGDDTLIHSCVNSSSGSLRIIDSDGGCRDNETPLDLSAEASGGLTGVERVSEVIEIPWPAKVHLSQSVNFPAGKLATGGGAKSFDVTGVSAGDFAIDSFPVGNPPTGWQADLYAGFRFGTGTAPFTLEVFAICATATL